jgi:purine catabolism regulator
VSGAELTEALGLEGEPALVAPHNDLICALIPGREDVELFDLAGRIAARVGTVVGAGRAVNADRTRRAFHEARFAYETVALGLLGELGAGEVRAATYRDLGSYQLLLSLQDDAALSLFCDSVLGSIERSEGHYGGELIRSLEAFIEENGQWERAAKRLYCHRHTLRYRIKRVEELTGRDLSSARDRIEFWLALRGRELVSA